MRLLPKSIHRCRRYPTKFNSGRDIPWRKDVLQWGRVLMNAETRRQGSSATRTFKLQWGRVLMNAETLRGSWFRWVCCEASMGPRSHERGNPAISERLRGTMGSLQWGRVLMNAETGRSSCSRATETWLQWGRVLMNAET